ncbi:MerR family transcriptional regulator, partial [Klebsiella pneumoniae]|uniref:MerR family transcriptional regulator n=1 Tax=Klebsiella pneumoniae TaxID=573 RepID=UPI003851A76E
MAKSSEAFRNIGEVAAELDVKKHVLRFWEAKFPQLKPMKRGGGRRLYRPSD